MWYSLGCPSFHAFLQGNFPYAPPDAPVALPADGCWAFWLEEGMVMVSTKVENKRSFKRVSAKRLLIKVTENLHAGLR
jgi:hypothetical protein